MMIRRDELSPEEWMSMCTPIDLVLPADERSKRGSLFIGSWIASMDSEILDSNHIDAILSINDEMMMMSLERADGRRSHRITLSDSTASDISPHLDGACRFISERLSKGDNVLVHCQQGISRSASIVIAYLMHERRLGYDVALSFLKEKRKCVKPNTTFEKVLRGWNSIDVKQNDSPARPKLEKVKWLQRQSSYSH